MSQKQASNVFAALLRHKYMSLSTFHKSGKAVATPVWFAEENGKLYLWTRIKSGKIKRIRNNHHVQLAPCTLLGKVVGPTIEGVARILAKNEEAPTETSIRRKFRWELRFGSLFRRFRREDRVYVEVVPEERK